MATVDELIAAQLARNEELTRAAVRASGEAMTAASSFSGAGAPFRAVAPALRSTPPAFTPNVDLGTEFTRGFQDAFNMFDPKVQAAITDYMARFFPAAVATVCDDWIQNTIVNGGTGVPAHIENAIWQRARARDVTEARRMGEEAANQFAARGFIMPPGALAARMLEVEQDAADKSATISRDTAIKNVEIEIQNIRFAIEQGLRVRTAVIQGVSGYIAAWLKPAEESVNYSRAMIEAKQKLWNSAADYYRAMVDEARMKLEATNITARSTDARATLDVQAFNEHVKTQANTALAVAQVMGQAAGGALNAAGSITSSTVQLVGAAPT